MNRFAPVLRRISRELDLPDAIRVRIVLEMAADLEALYAHYRGRGLSEEEAAQRAEEKVLASPETLGYLVSIHGSGYQALFARVSGRVQRGFAIVLFGTAVLPLLTLGVLSLLPQLTAARTPMYAWPIAAAGAVIALLTLLKAYHLYLRKEDAERRHLGLFPLFFLSIITPMIGVTGFLSSVYGLARQLAHAAPPPPVTLAGWVAQDAALFGVSILLGIGAGLGWFLFARRVGALERAESAYLLEGEDRAGSAARTGI